MQGPAGRQNQEGGIGTAAQFDTRLMSLWGSGDSPGSKQMRPWWIHVNMQCEKFATSRLMICGQTLRVLPVQCTMYSE